MLKNELLQQAQTTVEKTVKDRAAYDKIVAAGTKVIYDKETFSELIKGIETSNDPVLEVADGIVGVLGVLYKQSRKTMPLTPMISAGMTLLIDALDFLEQAGMATIDKETLGKATTMYMNSLLSKMGLTPDKMEGMLSQVRATMSDPEKMKQFRGGAA
ncbi:MAG: hypothetical protein KAX73_00910 [Aquabacterium sp.]|nr:hypothetical protein [Aquabacterium sp.]